MHAISVKELREKFPFVRSELKKGESFLIIHKSKPIAELKPLKNGNGEIFIEEIDEDFRNMEKIQMSQWKNDILPLTKEEVNYYLSLPPYKD